MNEDPETTTTDTDTDTDTTTTDTTAAIDTTTVESKPDAVADQKPSTEEKDGFDDFLATVPEGNRDALAALATLPEVRKLLGSQHAALQAKTKAEAESATAAQQATGALSQERDAMEALVGADFMAKLRAFAKGDESAAPPVPGSKEAVQAELRGMVAQMFGEILAPARQKWEEDASRARWDAFVARNPDIKDPEIRADVEKVLTEHTTVPTELALELVRGRRAMLAQEQKRVADETTRSTRRAALDKGGSAGGGHLDDEDGPTYDGHNEWDIFKRVAAERGVPLQG